MPNIAIALKQEIARVARKEIRDHTTNLQKATSSYRHEIAELKRRMAALERQLKALNKGTRSISRARVGDAGEQAGANLRFRPDGLKKHRQRLGLSANDVAKILGVSQLSVYKWESGKARPRAKQLALIAKLRTMGKKEAAARVEEVGNWKSFS